MNKDGKDKARLEATARAVYAALKAKIEGTGIHLKSIKITPADTDGWKATIGVLGAKGPQLQIWLDFQTGYPERKLWFGFRSVSRRKINDLIGRVAKTFVVRRRITIGDVNTRNHYQLKDLLPQGEFGVPIFENYWGRYFYFGMFDFSSLERTRTVNAGLCRRAAEFFESVAGAARTSKQPDYDGKLRKLLSSIASLKQSIPLPCPAKSVRPRILPTDSAFRLDPVLEMTSEQFDEWSQNRCALGQAAQSIALRAEQRRLHDAGYGKLAVQVKDVSNKPALGYDIRSFETDGKTRHIEVKAARKSGPHVSFFLTANERRASLRLKNYFFYLVFSPSAQAPQVFYIKARQLTQPSLTPESFAVNLTMHR